MLSLMDETGKGLISTGYFWGQGLLCLVNCDWDDREAGMGD